MAEYYAWSVGQSVAWGVDGLAAWLMASLVCRSVGGSVGHLVCWLLLCGLVDWLFALLTDGFGCFMGWLVACVGQAVSESFG